MPYAYSRPRADLRYLRAATVRTTGVLRNLPSGNSQLIDLRGRCLSRMSRSGALPTPDFTEKVNRSLSPNHKWHSGRCELFPLGYGFRSRGAGLSGSFDCWSRRRLSLGLRSRIWGQWHVAEKALDGADFEGWAFPAANSDGDRANNHLESSSCVGQYFSMDFANALK